MGGANENNWISFHHRLSPEASPSGADVSCVAPLQGLAHKLSLGKAQPPLAWLRVIVGVYSCQ